MREQRLRVGQIWERISDGTRYRITSVDTAFDDCTFHVLGQSRQGQVYGGWIRSRYRLVENPT